MAIVEGLESGLLRLCGESTASSLLEQRDQARDDRDTAERQRDAAVERAGKFSDLWQEAETAHRKSQLEIADLLKRLRAQENAWADERAARKRLEVDPRQPPEGGSVEAPDIDFGLEPVATEALPEGWQDWGHWSHAKTAFEMEAAGHRPSAEWHLALATYKVLVGMRELLEERGPS